MLRRGALMFGIAGYAASVALGQATTPKAPASPSSPAPASTAPEKAQPAKPGPKGAFDIAPQIEAIWQRLGSDEPLAKIAADAEQLFKVGVAYAPASGPASRQFTEVAALYRLTRQLADSKNTSAPAARKLLATNRGVAERLALTVLPDDDIAGVYARFIDLSKEFPNDITDKAGAANLVADICVVFDQQRRHPTHGAASASATETFGYFRTNAARMSFPLDKLPTELGIWVVSTNCSKNEMQWALQQHAGERAVGKLFDKISYDTEHFKRGTEKKVLATGDYSLMNIKKLGGVCAEQAYFASEVGKAIGVPAMYVRASGSDVAHAWVGYLKNDKTWDFTEGRDAGDGQYEDLTGEIINPQTNKPTTDATVGLTAGLLVVSPEQHDLAIAITDASAAMNQWRTRSTSGTWPPAAPEGFTGKARELSAAAELELLESATKASPAHEAIWRHLALLSSKGELPESQRQRWADSILRMCGKQSADFAIEILTPMIRSVTPAASQSKMWDWVAQQFHNRPDIGASARMEQGAMWVKEKDPSKAWAAYNEVVLKFANEGKVLSPALKAMERLLADQGKPQGVLALYEDAFRRISKPKAMSASAWRQSNYYKVGARYSDLLRDAGKKADADRIEKMVEPKQDKKGL